jgi:hypothetical protein
MVMVIEILFVPVKIQNHTNKKKDKKDKKDKKEIDIDINLFFVIYNYYTNSNIYIALITQIHKSSPISYLLYSRILITFDLQFLPKHN